MTLPSNFKHNILYPRILVHDNNGSLKYTHESKKIWPTGTRDFEISAIDLSLGQFDNYGSLVVIIPDHDGNFIDTSTSDIKSVFEREWSIQMYLTPDGTEQNRWFYGKIRDAYIDRAGTNQQQIVLLCIGWGVILKERMTRLIRNQGKDADGETLDTSDDATKISELLLDLFQDTDHQIDTNISQLTTITAQTSTTGTGIDETATSTKLANVNFTTSTYAQAISSLSAIANTMWRVDEDRRLIIHDAGTYNSGFIFSNDMATTGDTANWNTNRIGYLLNAPISWYDTTAESRYNFIHGFGHFSPSLNSSDGGTPDASDNLDTAWHAIPISTTTDNLFKIAIRAIKTGTPTSKGSVQIWGDSGGSGPDPDDVRRKIDLNEIKLQSLGTSTPADWLEIPIKPKLSVTPNEPLYLVFPKYGDASNTFNVNYESGSGTFWDSSDGVTWTSRTGKPAYRIYDARRLITTVEILDATDKLPEPREKLLPVRSDLETDTVRKSLISAGEVLGKEHRVYDNFIISVPYEKPEVGWSARVIDKKTGLDVNANITGLQLSADATSGNIGFESMEVSMEAFI